MRIVIKYVDNTIREVVVDTELEIQECMKSFVDAYANNSACVLLDTRREAIIIVLHDIRSIEYVHELTGDV